MNDDLSYMTPGERARYADGSWLIPLEDEPLDADGSPTGAEEP